MLFLHSYDAAEDNEISFREGEKIIQIEPASEDWWEGKNAHGDVGLFPGMFSCNFVEVGC
jgi:hypothetical protein